MSTKFVLLAVMAGALLSPGTAHAVPDYPPSGAAVEIEGDLVTGGTIEVRVRNCTLGEVVRTSIESLPSVDALCESPITSFADPATADGGRPGMSTHQMRLPDDPGILKGSADLLETDEVLTFFLDVRSEDVTSPVVAQTPPSTGGLSGWPFLLLALLIATGVVVAVVWHRRPETP